jgi:hypothetical protein
MKTRNFLLSALIALSISVLPFTAPPAHAQNVGDVVNAVKTIKGGISTFQKLFTDIVSLPNQLFSQATDLLSTVTSGFSEFLLGTGTDDTYSFGPQLTSILGDDISDPFEAFKKLEVSSADTELLNPYSSDAFQDRQNLVANAKGAFVEGYAKQSLDKKGQNRAKKLGEGVKQTAEEAAQCADDAQGLDVTQDVQKQIVCQNTAIASNTALANLLGIKSDQNAQVANFAHAQTNKELSKMNMSRQVDDQGIGNLSNSEMDGFSIKPSKE